MDQALINLIKMAKLKLKIQKLKKKINKRRFYTNNHGRDSWKIKKLSDFSLSWGHLFATNPVYWYSITLIKCFIKLKNDGLYWQVSSMEHNGPKVLVNLIILTNFVQNPKVKKILHQQSGRGKWESYQKNFSLLSECTSSWWTWPIERPSLFVLLQVAASRKS